MKKKNMRTSIKHRTFAMILALIMVITSIPNTLLAEGALNGADSEHFEINEEAYDTYEDDQLSGAGEFPEQETYDTFTSIESISVDDEIYIGESAVFTVLIKNTNISVTSGSVLSLSIYPEENTEQPAFVTSSDLEISEQFSKTFEWTPLETGNYTVEAKITHVSDGLEEKSITKSTFITVYSKNAPTHALFSAQSICVSVTMQEDNMFIIPLVPGNEIEVSAGLAGRYGYVYGANIGEGDITVLDVLVAAHIQAFGSDENLTDFLKVPNGVIGTIMGITTSDFGFNVNGRQSHGNQWTPGGGGYPGYYNGYLVNEAVVNADDIVDFFFYGDTFSYMDYTAWFEKNGEKQSELTVNKGEALDLTLNGYMLVYYGMSDDATIESFTEPMADIQIGIVDLVYGPIEPIDGKITDDDGAVTLQFDQAGTYVVSAVGDTYTSIISPYLTVHVVDAQTPVYTDNVNVYASYCSDTSAIYPKRMLNISAGYAVNTHGFASDGLSANSDKVTVFDVLAQVICEKAGSTQFSSNKVNFLSINQDGTLVKVDNFPTPATNGYTVFVNSKAVDINKLDDICLQNGDEVLIMRAGTGKEYQIAWFEDGQGTRPSVIQIDPNEPVALFLKGVDWKGGNTVNTLTGVQIGLLSEFATSPTFTAMSENIKTDIDGKVELSFEKPGNYNVTAYSSDGITIDGKTYRVPYTQILISVKDDASASISNFKYFVSSSNNYYGIDRVFSDADSLVYRESTSITAKKDTWIIGEVAAGASVKVNNQSVAVEESGRFKAADPLSGTNIPDSYGLINVEVTSADKAQTKNHSVIVYYGMNSGKTLPLYEGLADSPGAPLDELDYKYNGTDSRHYHKATVINSIDEIRIKGKLDDTIQPDAVRLRTINRDGSFGAYIDGAVTNALGGSFITNTVPLEIGVNLLLFETKIAGQWRQHGVFEINRDADTTKSKDISFDLNETFAFTDANGNKLIPQVLAEPLEDANGTICWTIQLPAGEEQSKVTTNLLKKPGTGDTQTYFGAGTVTVTWQSLNVDGVKDTTLPVTMAELINEYTTYIRLRVLAENGISEKMYQVKIVRAAEEITSDLATILTKVNITPKNISGINQTAGIQLRRPDAVNPLLPGVSITPMGIQYESNNNNPVSAETDPTVLFVSAGLLSGEINASQQSPIASISINPELLLKARGATYSIVVNGNQTIAERVSSGEYLIPHIGGYTYGANGEQNGIDVTFIQVVVHPPAGYNYADRTYTFVVPKVASASADFTNMSVLSGSVYNFLPGEGELRIEGKASKSFIESELHYYVSVNYNVDKIGFYPTINTGDISTIRCTLNGNNIPVGFDPRGKVYALAELEVGDNLVTMSGSTKTYTFNVIRSKSYNLKEPAFSAGVVLAGKFSPTRNVIAIADTNINQYTIHLETDDSTNTVTIYENGQVKASGIGQSGATLSINSDVKIRVSDADNYHEYPVSVNKRNNAAADRVYAFLPAPGHFTNEQAQTVTGTAGGFGWGEGWDTSLYADDTTTAGAPSGKPGISLGSFGGYIIYEYNNPIQNSSQNIYGADFIISGNQFAGNNEPAAVMVAQDLDKDGKPDKWYNLAGSEHYEDKTDWNYSVTYTNPNTSFTPNIAQNIPWKDGLGNTGVIYVNSFHTQIYYPNPINFGFSGNAAMSEYNVDHITLSGVNINTTDVNGFGYADTCSYDTSTKFVSGNPYYNDYTAFDISWAVDETGIPVRLDEVSFIKVYTCQQTDGGGLGEKSSEVLAIARRDAGTGNYGITKAPKSVTISSEGFESFEVPFEEGKADYDVFVGDMKFVKLSAVGEADDIMYINNQRLMSGQQTKVTYEVTNNPRLIRVITQNGDKQPNIIMLRFTSGAKPVETLLTGLRAERNGSEIALSRDTENKYSVTVPYITTSIQVVPTVVAGSTVKVNGMNLNENGKSSLIELSAGQKTIITIEVQKGSQTEVVTLEATREANNDGVIPGQGDITVTFSLLGAPIHNGNGPNLVYKNNPEKFIVWIPETSYTLPAGSSVGDVFAMALNNARLNYRIWSNGNYISGIQTPEGEWLEEFTNGRNSGWMYTINGTHPLFGLAEYKLKGGERIVWHYTDDYIYEEGSEQWLDKNIQQKPGGPTGIIASPGSSGVATSTLSGTKLEDFLEALKDLEDKEGAEAKLEVELPKDAIGVTVALPQKIVQELLLKEHTSISITTAIGNLTLEPKTVKAMANAAGSGNVVICIKESTETKLPQITGMVVSRYKVYEFSILANNKVLDNFNGGSIAVFLPYELKESERAEHMKVYYIADENTATEVEGSAYDKERKGMTFKTGHFSAFAIVSVAPEKAVPEAEKSAIIFTDVPDNHWAKEYIDYLSARKLIQGVGENQFAPEKDITRAEFVTMLFNLSGANEKGANVNLTDVAPNAWYAPAVEWAYQNGITSGTSDTTFSPHSKISRQDMAVMMNRYMVYMNFKMEDKNSISEFSDNNEIDDYAKDAVYSMQQAGVISGRSKNYFAPRESATRAEAAKIMAVVHQAMAAKTNTLK